MSLSPNLLNMLTDASLETLYMVSISAILTTIFGIPLGVTLVVTRRGHIMEHRWLIGVLGAIVNAVRSVPFIIFIIAIIPFTRFLVGKYIGPTAVIVPLTLAAIPFMARMTETALLEVPFGVIEAAQAAGASTLQIIWRVLLAEAKPGLIQGATIMIINLIGYSAMAGAVGGGGLGALAVNYGYARYRPDVMLSTVVLLIVCVQAIQSAGDWLSRSFDRR